MKVLHFVESFSPFTETPVYENICSLEEDFGVHNHVVCISRVNEKIRPFPRVTLIRRFLKGDYRRKLRSVLARVGLLPKFSTTEPALREQLQEIIGREKPDVIHAHFGPMGLIVAPLARKHGIPLVVTYYGYDVSRLMQQPTWLRRYRKFWASAHHAVLAEDMKKDLVKYQCPEDRIHVIHVGRRNNIAKKIEVSAPASRWVSVGRFTEKKGFIDLVRAFAMLIDKGYDITLDLIGEGELSAEVAAEVNHLGIGDRVQLCGAMTNDEVLERLNHYDAFILASKTAADGDKEGTPVVLMEAMLAGLPCVSTWHAGIPEIFPEANHAYLAKEGDVSEIAHCVEALLALDAQALAHIGERGREKILADFNHAKEVAKLAELYKNVVCD